MLHAESVGGATMSTMPMLPKFTSYVSVPSDEENYIQDCLGEFDTSAEAEAACVAAVQERRGQHADVSAWYDAPGGMLFMLNQDGEFEQYAEPVSETVELVDNNDQDEQQEDEGDAPPLDEQETEDSDVESAVDQFIDNDDEGNVGQDSEDNQDVDQSDDENTVEASGVTETLGYRQWYQFLSERLREDDWDTESLTRRISRRLAGEVAILSDEDANESDPVNEVCPEDDAQPASPFGFDQEE